MKATKLILKMHKGIYVSKNKIEKTENSNVVETNEKSSFENSSMISVDQKNTLHLENSFVENFNSEMNKAPKGKKDPKPSPPKHFFFALELLIQNIPSSNLKGILKLALLSTKGKIQLFLIEKDITNELMKLSKNENREGRIVLNVEIKESIIMESEEIEFEFVATLNETFVSNALKISKDESKIELFKMKREFGEFSNTLMKELKSKLTKREEEIQKKKQELEDKEKKKSSSSSIVKKKMEVKEISKKKKIEFFCTMKKGKYRHAKEKKYVSSKRFTFPIVIKGFESNSHYGDYINFRFFDKDNVHFASKAIYIEKKSKDHVYNEELEIYENDIIYAEFPVRIDIFTSTHYSKSIVLKSVELGQSVTGLLEKKIEKNMVSVLAELKAAKFKKKPRKVVEKEEKIFAINLNDLPYEMIYEILSFVPMKYVFHSLTFVSKYFNTISNFQLERRTKVFLLQRSGIGKKILLFMFRQFKTWRQVYHKLRIISKFALGSNVAMKDSERKENLKEKEPHIWLTKDVYDDAGATIVYSRRHWF